jgi:hypothetical protein
VSQYAQFNPTSRTSAFAGMPTRSLHARGAVAPGRYFRVRGLGGITRFKQPRCRQPAPPPPAVRRRDRRRAEPVKFWRLRISGEGAGALEDAGLSDQ